MIGLQAVNCSVFATKIWPASLLFCTALTLAGCGGVVVERASSGVLAVHGHVHGGQQPVANSSIALYRVGVDGSPSVPMLKFPVLTAGDGTFDLTADYTCQSNTDQVYLVATGGNPGLSPASDNPALVLVSAFGACGNLASASYLEINEVTTVAAAWALAPFITSAAQIGTSHTNSNALASAFLNAQLLADSGTGLAATLPSNLAIEKDKLYALADALAPCVNSDGTTGCEPLFAAANVTAPSDTLSAALSVVRNPGRNVAEVFGTLNAERPFPTALKQAPHDWTMSLTVTGGGLVSPTSLALDSFNNVWVGNYPGGLSAFSPQGAPLNATGYGVGVLSEVYGLTVDFNDNIWVTNEQQPHHRPTQGSVTAFLGAGSGSMGSYLTGTPYLSNASIDFPIALAADTNGNILIANYGDSTATIYSDTGSFVEGSVGSGSIYTPSSVVPDLNHGLWVADQGKDSVTHLSSTGTLLALKTNCCPGADAVAMDKFNNAWVSNFDDGSISEFADDGTALLDRVSGGGTAANGPATLVFDAAQNLWVADYYGQNFSEFAGNASTLAPGTAISPTAGYGLDAHLVEPYAIAPDAAGNLWVSNFGASTLTMFFGLAAPTRTPLLPTPTAP